MRGVVFVAGLVGVAAVAGLPMRAAQAGDTPSAPVVVSTEYLEFEIWPRQRNASDPTDRLANLPARTIALGTVRPEGVKKAPAGALFGALPSGRRVLCVAFVAGAAPKADLLVDVNGDGDLTEPGESLTVAGLANGAATLWRSRWTIGGAAIQLDVMRTPANEKGPEQIVCGTNVTGARRGQVDVGGVRYALHLVDRDLDGSYTSPDDRWWFGPTTQLAKVRALSPNSMFETGEPAFTPTPWRLVSVDAAGKAVVRPDPAAGTVDAYFARRSERVMHEVWEPRFRKEEAEFRAKKGIDPARPLATTPVPWLHDVSLDAARARAAREGKPLLVDFEADWCEWCYRFEWYLYRDAEVAAAISKFIPVKVNFEFHTAGEFERLKAPASLPVVFFLDAVGTPVTFTPPVVDAKPAADGKPASTDPTFRVSQFQTPAQFAATIRAAYEAWQKQNR